MYVRLEARVGVMDFFQNLMIILNEIDANKLGESKIAYYKIKTITDQAVMLGQESSSSTSSKSFPFISDNNMK